MKCDSLFIRSIEHSCSIYFSRQRVDCHGHHFSGCMDSFFIDRSSNSYKIGVSIFFFRAYENERKKNKYSITNS